MCMNVCVCVYKCVCVCVCDFCIVLTKVTTSHLFIDFFTKDN